MKKTLSILLAALLLGASATTTVTASDIGESKGTVPKIAKNIIKVDGTKDEAYDQALIVDINQYLQGAEDGATGKAYMLWADGAFYFLAEVTDKDICIPTAEKQNSAPWESDSVEMFFDFGNEHADLVQQFRVDVTGFPSYYSEGGVDSAYGPELAAPYFDEYAAVQTDTGYNIEMMVDLEKYYLAEGQSIGLQLQINDMVADGTSQNVFNMASSLNAGSWDVDLYDYVTLGSQLDIAAPVAEEAAEPSGPVPVASSGAEVPADSVFIAGEIIGNLTGWDGTEACGRAAAFDGNVATFFDPLGVGDGYVGIDAGEEMILTKIMIHPRTTYLDRFSGATIEASNDPDFEESVEIFYSDEAATEVAFVDCTDGIDQSVNTGYRYFRYINYMNHGDVGEVELYGKAKDGSNPTYAVAAVAAEVAEEAPAAVSDAAPYAAFYPASEFEIDAGEFMEFDTLEGSINEKVLTCIVSDSDASGDGATFTFNVPEDGKYAIWGRVYFPGQSNNSIHYSVDDGPSMIWDFPDEDADDTPCYNSWQYFYLTNRAVDIYEDENLYGTFTLENNEWRHAPNMLDLTKGLHSIHLVGRETGWYLDEIIVTNVGIQEYDPNACEGNDAILEVCKFCGPEWQHYYKDVYSVKGVTAEQYFTETLYPAEVEEAPVVEEAPAVEETPAAEEVVEEAPAEEVVEEVVEEVAEETPAPETAPQTFDFGVFAAIAAVLSLAGITLGKKRN